MKHSNTLIQEFVTGTYDHLLTDIYIDSSRISYQKQRYINAIKQYEEIFGYGDIEIYSAPGRSEIGGNHTDHQHGEVLAASINKDAIAVVGKIDIPCVQIVSGTDNILTIALDSLNQETKESGTTLALIKGVLTGMKNRNYSIGGFQAYITSDVLIGAGLSSSAAFETLIGTIISGLYNDMKINPVEIAMIGQYAENVYFGKPCGLMDQMTCSMGNLVHIDFENPNQPIVNRINFDMTKHGYSLCIVDTKGSHANLTPDYAAIPQEMKDVAACFGKEVLRQVTREEILDNLNLIRTKVNDRAALRAIHFYEENNRVQQEVSALQSGNITDFLQIVQESGNSSFKYLQNVYTSNDVARQNISIALATSDCILGDKGVSRVHGGGFAGTIQAFVKNEFVNVYQKEMNKIFGDGACAVLSIRKYGGIRVI